jgi:hypothetical protein
MEALGRVELPTNGLGNRCSIHLSYRASATHRLSHVALLTTALPRRTRYGLETRIARGSRAESNDAGRHSLHPRRNLLQLQLSARILCAIG